MKASVFFPGGHDRRLGRIFKNQKNQINVVERRSQENRVVLSTDVQVKDQINVVERRSQENRVVLSTDVQRKDQINVVERRSQERSNQRR